jgi:uncharacterized membrane protein YfcA
MLFALVVCLLVIAALYGAVGHGGASGYIAIMALLGYSQQWIRQDALVLNLLVSGIAFWQFYRSGYFQWKLFFPLALGSVPLAFLGGSMQLESDWYKILLGAMLLIPALLFLADIKKGETNTRPLPFYGALGIGVVLGFISGLTGIGGGVLLSPLLVMQRWAGQKTTAAISAPFIFVNSLAGLLGMSLHTQQWDPNIGYFAMATVLGGVLGATLGARKFGAGLLKKILGVVLLIAALKLLFV